MPQDPVLDRPVYGIKAELFKALGHPVRVRTMELLAGGERPVSELLADIGVEASHLSQHLAVLRRAGVVTAVRSGNSVTYALADPSLADLLAAARTFLLHRLDSANQTLTQLHEEEAGA